MTNSGYIIKELEGLLGNKLIRKAKVNLLDFAKYTTDTEFISSNFHKQYYKLLDKFAKGKLKRLIISVPPQHGKLLPEDTPVLTTKGWKPHGMLKKGDYVFGQDGKPKKVIWNSGVYHWNVDQITFNDGNTILAAKEHLWNLEVEYDDRKGRRNRILETQEIFAKKNRRSPYIKCSPSLDIPERELPIDPYILGCWLGDGSSRQGKLTVGKQDIDHFSKLGEAREVREGVYAVLIDGLSKKLRLNNLILNKHILIEYLLSSHDQRMELLRSLMDTDGYVDQRGNCEFAQKEGQLAKDVYTLIRSLGIKCRTKTYNATLKGKIVGKKVRIGFNPNKTDIIFNLPRKQERVYNKSKSDRDDKYKFFIKSNVGIELIGHSCQIINIVTIFRIIMMKEFFYYCFYIVKIKSFVV